MIFLRVKVPRFWLLEVQSPVNKITGDWATLSTAGTGRWQVD